MDEKSVFSNTPAVLPVIHLDGSHDQALRNAETAFTAGADGIFLIGHSSRYGEVLAIWRMVQARMPERWIGVNLLDCDSPDAMFVVPAEVPGLWVDDGGVCISTTYQAARVDQIRKRRGWNGELYGGVAFKTQVPYVGDPDEAARLAHAAAPFMDVVTTSGPRTGVPPSAEKLRAMRDAITGQALLGCASGLTAENVGSRREFLDRILVATGISKPGDFHNIDLELARRFIGNARG